MTELAYDNSRGFLVVATRTDPLIGDTDLDYDGFNRQAVTIDPNGSRTETTYDAMGRPLEIRVCGDACGGVDDMVTTHVYNTFGDLSSTTLPRGNVIEYKYEPIVGRLTEIHRKPNLATNFERVLYGYDAPTGLRTSEKHQRWDGSAFSLTDSETQTVYKSRCHVEKTVQGSAGGAQSTTEYQYDCKGRLTHVWDANHPKATFPNGFTQYGYDTLDRLVLVSQPWGGAGGGLVDTAYEYDVQDHLKKVTDAEGNETTYVYSDRDLITEEQSGVSGTTAYSYDEHGNLLRKIDARGMQIDNAFDPLDRLGEVRTCTTAVPVVPCAGAALIAHEYDDPAVEAIGRLRRTTRGANVIEHTYDEYGRQLQDGALTYGYDKNSNRATLDYPAGVIATYTYDSADRPLSLVVADRPSPAARSTRRPDRCRRSRSAMGSRKYEVSTRATSQPRSRSRACRRGPTDRSTPSATSSRSPTGPSPVLRLPGLPVLPDQRRRPVGKPRLDLRWDRQPTDVDARRRRGDLPLRLQWRREPAGARLRRPAPGDRRHSRLRPMVLPATSRRSPLAPISSRSPTTISEA